MYITQASYITHHWSLLGNNQHNTVMSISDYQRNVFHVVTFCSHRVSVRDYQLCVMLYVFVPQAHVHLVSWHHFVREHWYVCVCVCVFVSTPEGINNKLQ